MKYKKSVNIEKIDQKINELRENIHKLQLFSFNIAKGVIAGVFLAVWIQLLLLPISFDSATMNLYYRADLNYVLEISFPFVLLIVIALLIAIYFYRGKGIQKLSFNYPHMSEKDLWFIFDYLLFTRKDMVGNRFPDDIELEDDEENKVISFVRYRINPDFIRFLRFLRNPNISNEEYEKDVGFGRSVYLDIRFRDREAIIHFDQYRGSKIYSVLEYIRDVINEFEENEKRAKLESKLHTKK